MDRVAILWTRVITPQNIDISIQSPGISPLGTLGVKGEVDNRWGERLSGALMFSLASDALKYAIQTRTPGIETVTYNAFGAPIITREPFKSSTISNVEKFVEEDLSRSMRLTPRVVVLQGTVVSILTAQDLNFSQVLSDR
jgi:type IV secretion system protein VirB10